LWDEQMATARPTAADRESDRLRRDADARRSDTGAGATLQSTKIDNPFQGRSPGRR
jgi:hypothetical protein